MVFFLKKMQLYEEGIINQLSKQWMHKNSAKLCGIDATEGTQFKAIFVLVVVLISGIAMSLLLMLGEWLIHIGKGFVLAQVIQRIRSPNLINESSELKVDENSVSSVNESSSTLNKVKNYAEIVFEQRRKKELADLFDTAFSENSL